jgi:CDP-alcohol phosphatidyltransferase
MMTFLTVPSRAGIRCHADPDGGRKIPGRYEQPLDNVLISLGTVLNPLWAWLGLTPNALTLVSILLGLGSVFCIVTRRYIWAGLLLLLSYAFDCFDGNYARACGMVTDFGDWFDHVGDVIVRCVLVPGAILWRLRTWRERSLFAGFLFVAACLGAVHMGCQERLYGDNNDTDTDTDTDTDIDTDHSGSSETVLTPLTRLCPHGLFVKVTKSMGLGLIVVLIEVAIYWLWLNDYTEQKRKLTTTTTTTRPRLRLR